MNPQLIAAIVGAVGGFAGAILGTVIMAVVQSTIARKNRQQQLRMAALDKRLQAHQEAYNLWQKMYWASSSGDDEQIRSAVDESQQWWQESCLYLEPAVREAFLSMIAAAWHRFILLGTGKSRVREGRASSEELRRVHEEIKRVGPLIEEAVGLPPFSDELTEVVAKQRDVGSDG